MKNFILSAFSSLFLSFIVVGAQDVKFILYLVVVLLIQILQSPIPGTYFIVNSVPSPAGDRLAATFQDGQSDVTVTPLTGSELQRVWLDTSIVILLSISLDIFYSGSSQIPTQMARNLSYLLPPSPKQ